MYNSGLKYICNIAHPLPLPFAGCFIIPDGRSLPRTPSGSVCSKFVHAVASIRILVVLKLDRIPLYVYTSFCYPFSCWWTFVSFLPSAAVVNAAEGVQAGVWVLLSLIWGRYLHVGLWVLWELCVRLFEEPPNCFPQSPVLHFPWWWAEFQFSYILTNADFPSCFSQQFCYWRCSNSSVFRFAFLSDSRYSAAFHGFLDNLYVIFGEISIEVFCPFKNWVVCYFVVEL